MERISVLMCIYNEPASFIYESVNSILSQTYKDLELIVIADDPTNSLAIDTIVDMIQKDDRIKLYVNENNMGLSKSLNRALSYASGDYIARMDADDISMPERLEKEMQVMKQHNFEIIASGTIKIDMEGNTIGKDTICFSPQSISALLRYTDVLPHPTWLVKKEIYDKLGGYRDFFSCEDYDFLLRAKKKNMRFGMAPYLLLKYRSNDKGISQTNTLRQTLATHYLSKNYARIDEVTSEELAKYILDNMTQENIKKYSIHSEKLFKIARKAEISMADILEIFRSILSCKYISYNYKQILLKKLYSFRENQVIRD